MKESPIETGSGPQVSIGLPVYNGAATLREAIESLLSQSFRDFELIISDNASDDDTGQICSEYAVNDSRVRYIRQSVNRGAAENFQAVLEAARGTFFMWAAHDDVWEGEFLFQMVELLKENPDAVLAFSKLASINQDGEHVREYDLGRISAAESPVETLTRFLQEREEDGKANLFYGLMRREALLRAGGLRIWAGDWGADMLIVFRILCFGGLATSDQVLFHKRLPPVAESNALSQRAQLDALRSELEQWDTYWNGYRLLIDAHESLSIEERKKLLRTVASCRRARRRKVHRRIMQVYRRMLKRSLKDVFRSKKSEDARVRSAA